MSMEKLRERMGEQGLDAIVAASPENFYYATGYEKLTSLSRELVSVG